MGNDKTLFLSLALNPIRIINQSKCGGLRDWGVVRQSDRHTLPVVEQGRLQVSRNTLLSAPHQRQAVGVCVCVLKCLRDYGHAGLCADPCMHVWPSILMTGWTMTGTESIIFSLGMHNSINRHCKAHTKILSGFPSASTFCNFCPNCPLKYPEYQEEEKKLIIIKSHKKRWNYWEENK